ncbi:unnamed protein product [Peniophora sp. CBMAI 1063]|nr:unnamed protein product [Peniophora sp. CBMAI 1063]
MASVCALPDDVLLLIFISLKSVSPAGRYYTAVKRLGLGWIVAGHVCQGWRRVLLGSATLWTDVTDFYDLQVIAEFARRSRNAPLNIDLDVLFENAIHRTPDFNVSGHVLRNEMWSRAYRINLDVVRSARYRRHMPISTYTTACRVLSTTHLSNLVEINAFIPRGSRITAFAAPRLQTLRLSSDAAKMLQCPMPYETLSHFLSQTESLVHIYLHRAVDTAFDGRRILKRETKRVGIKMLDIGSFDEDLLALIFCHCELTTGAHSSVDLYGVKDLQYSIELCDSLLPASTRSAAAYISRRRERPHALDGIGRSFTSDFYALRLSFNDVHTVTWRKDLLDPSWTWTEFTNSYACDTVTSLRLRDSVYENPDEDVTDTPKPFIESLSGLRSLSLEHESHFEIVQALPDAGQLSNIRLKNAGLSDLIHAWHFVRKMNRPRETIDVVLQGKIFLDFEVSMQQHEYDEAPVLAALGALCTVTDKRTVLMSSNLPY